VPKFKKKEGPMKRLSTVGLDLAKEIFHLHGVDKKGNIMFRKKLKRKDLATFMVNLEPCIVGMESCGGANFWARKFRTMGHTPKIIQAKFVKPYVKSNKNDRVDAEAICEAVRRPNMRFVPIKDIWQQDIQSLHRIRSRLIQNKTALSNSIRGLLMEYGITIPRGISNLKRHIVIIINNQDNELTDFARKSFSGLYEEFKRIESEIAVCDKEITGICSTNEKCKKVSTIPGVGPITATAVIAQIGNGRDFKNGREYAAYLGLVPRHSGTGGKNQMLGISKRGDKYIRTQMIHGSRSILLRSHLREDRLSKWINAKKLSKGFNKTCVAYANKKARIIWAILANDTEYRAI